MLVWIVIITIFVLAFISGWKNPQSLDRDNKSKESELEPIFDDGEIVGWIEEEK